MPIFRPTHEPQNTEQYLDDLTRRLNSGLPRVKAEQIAGEAQAHLLDQVEDLIASGVTPLEAQAQAVSGFGPVRYYAQAATLAAYGDRTSARWRLVGRLATANVFALMACGMLLPLYATPGIGILVGFFALSALLVPLSAWGSRLPQPRTYAVLLGIATLVLAVGAGMRYAPNKNTPPILLATPFGQQISLNGFTVSTSRSVGPGLLRGTFDDAPASYTRIACLHQQEQKQLVLGQSIFANGLPVPASLRSGTRFIVPHLYQGGTNHGWPEMNASAFRDLSFPVYADLSRQIPEKPLPVSTVATYAEAKKVWTERGTFWIRHKASAIQYCAETALAYKQLQAVPLGFNTTAMTCFVSLFLQWGALLLLVDFLFAHLGRAFWISMLNRASRYTRHA